MNDDHEYALTHAVNWLLTIPYYENLLKANAIRCQCRQETEKPTYMSSNNLLQCIHAFLNNQNIVEYIDTVVQSNTQQNFTQITTNSLTRSSQKA